MKKDIILAIDNKNAILSDLKVLLEDNNYQVIIANSAEEGIEKLKNLKVLPDLILCEAPLSGMSEYEFFIILDNHPDWTMIPFIFHTIYNNLDEVRWGKNLGADDYITTPFAFLDLLAILEGKLNKSQKRKKQKYNNKFVNPKGNLEQPIEIDYKIQIIKTMIKQNNIKQMVDLIHSFIKSIKHLFNFKKTELYIKQNNENFFTTYKIAQNQKIENLVKQIENSINDEKEPIKELEIDIIKSNEVSFEKLIAILYKSKKDYSLAPFFTDYNSFYTNEVSLLYKLYKRKGYDINLDFKKFLRYGNSIALVPIKTEKSFYGFLYLSDPRKNLFRNNNLYLIELYCKNFATLMDNINDHKKMKQN